MAGRGKKTKQLTMNGKFDSLLRASGLSTNAMFEIQRSESGVPEEIKAALDFEGLKVLQKVFKLYHLKLDDLLTGGERARQNVRLPDLSDALLKWVMVMTTTGSQKTANARFSAADLDMLKNSNDNIAAALDALEKEKMLILSEPSEPEPAPPVGEIVDAEFVEVVEVPKFKPEHSSDGVDV